MFKLLLLITFAIKTTLQKHNFSVIESDLHCGHTQGLNDDTNFYVVDRLSSLATYNAFYQDYVYWYYYNMTQINSIGTELVTNITAEQQKHGNLGLMFQCSKYWVSGKSCCNYESMMNLARVVVGLFQHLLQYTKAPHYATSIFLVKMLFDKNCLYTTNMPLILALNSTEYGEANGREIRYKDTSPYYQHYETILNNSFYNFYNPSIALNQTWTTRYYIYKDLMRKLFLMQRQLYHAGMCMRCLSTEDFRIFFQPNFGVRMDNLQGKSHYLFIYERNWFNATMKLLADRTWRIHTFFASTQTIFLSALTTLKVNSTACFNLKNFSQTDGDIRLRNRKVCLSYQTCRQKVLTFSSRIYFPYMSYLHQFAVNQTILLRYANAFGNFYPIEYAISDDPTLGFKGNVTYTVRTTKTQTLAQVYTNNPNSAYYQTDDSLLAYGEEWVYTVPS